MKRLILEPQGWPCTLAECPPGPFVHKDYYGFKSEYRTSTGQIQAFNDVGEFFMAGAGSEVERAKLIVQPVVPRWIEEEQ